MRALVCVDSGQPTCLGPPLRGVGPQGAPPVHARLHTHNFSEIQLVSFTEPLHFIIT